MKLKSYLFGTAFAIYGLSAQAITFNTVQLAESKITFISKQMNVPVAGQFKQFDAQVQFDPNQPETAQAQVTIALDSIDAGSAEANEEVQGKNWFHIKQFPTATFSATQVKLLDTHRYELAGNMTIKGHTHPIIAPFTIQATEKEALIQGEFTLQRSQFKLGEGIWADTETVADDVQIRFTFKLLSQP